MTPVTISLSTVVFMHEISVENYNRKTYEKTHVFLGEINLWKNMCFSICFSNKLEENIFRTFL